VKIDTKAKYDARYRKRGAKRLQSWARSYMKSMTFEVRTGDGNKPEHEKRYANIRDCFPLLQVGHEL
jgi:hypothetical protein